MATRPLIRPRGCERRDRTRGAGCTCRALLATGIRMSQASTVMPSTRNACWESPRFKSGLVVVREVDMGAPLRDPMIAVRGIVESHAAQGNEYVLGCLS